ncbi:MAG: putative 4-mercaptohistidine N1-methyltransferase [Verrucomicrobiota bacterium]
MSIYETEALLHQYLLFHYGTPEETLPWEFGPHSALRFPRRIVSETFGPFPANARALDLGCAVGGSSFELARHCQEVVGIDFSQSFIDACHRLQVHGRLDYDRCGEGDLVTRLSASVPPEIDRSRVRFEVGDAMELREDLGQFDAVLVANLLCRLPEPRRCLRRLTELVAPGGQLVISTPSSWMEAFTPREHWLGGFERNGAMVATLDGVREHLEPAFELVRTLDLPFLIREHARKFQWCVPQVSVWRKFPA